MASSLKSSRQSSATLILKIKNGELQIYPIGNSDKEVADALAAFRDALVVGDLAVLIE
jgi:hypothetical protein